MASPGAVVLVLEEFMSSSHGPEAEDILKDVPVLVVEDSWHVAKAMKSALVQLGMRVVGPALGGGTEAHAGAGRREPQEGVGLRPY